jgi:hypothetical protein
MSITITEMVKIQLEGNRSSWTIGIDDMTIVNDTKFVKLPRSDVSTSAFARLIMGSSKVEGEITSMCGSLGLALLIRLRNEGQAAHMSDIPAGLVGIVEEHEMPLKKKKISRQECEDARNAPSVIEIVVPADGESPSFTMQVLRPVHSRDDLWVPLCKDVLANLVLYLQTAGFGTEPLPRRRDVTLPAGVQMRTQPKTLKTYFIVKQPDQQTKRAHSLEAATILIDGQ